MHHFKEYISKKKALNSVEQYYKRWIINIVKGKTIIYPSETFLLPFYKINYGSNWSTSTFLVNALSGEVLIMPSDQLRRTKLIESLFTSNILEKTIDEQKAKEYLIDKLKYNQKKFKLYQKKGFEIREIKFIYYPFYLFYIKNKKYDIALVDAITAKLDFKNKCYLEKKLLQDYQAI